MKIGTMGDKIKELAKMIDHSVLHPTLTDIDLMRECEIARKYNVASVCVKPYAVSQAVEYLKGSDVLVGCVIGFPAGNSAIDVKDFEVKNACRDGAVEIDMVINIGKALQGDWEYIEEEVKVITNTCHENGAIVKVIFETDFVSKEEDIIKLCEICTRIGVDFVKTSTGFGFVKQTNGDYNYVGATIPILKLMKKNIGVNVKLKAAGGIRTLDQLIEVKKVGCDRCGATATQAIMDDAARKYNQ